MYLYCKKMRNTRTR